MQSLHNSGQRLARQRRKQLLQCLGRHAENGQLDLVQYACSWWCLLTHVVTQRHRKFPTIPVCLILSSARTDGSWCKDRRQLVQRQMAIHPKEIHLLPRCLTISNILTFCLMLLCRRRDRSLLERKTHFATLSLYLQNLHCLSHALLCRNRQKTERSRTLCHAASLSPASSLFVWISSVQEETKALQKEANLCVKCCLPVSSIIAVCVILFCAGKDRSLVDWNPPFFHPAS